MNSLQLLEKINDIRSLSGHCLIKHGTLMTRIKLLEPSAEKGEYLAKSNKQEPMLINLSDYVISAVMPNSMVNSRAYNDSERAALLTIEQLLCITLERQYSVGKYRLDGYCIDTNTAYEIDGHGHSSPVAIKADKARQAFITKEIGCSFVRIKI